MSRNLREGKFSSSDVVYWVGYAKGRGQSEDLLNRRNHILEEVEDQFDIFSDGHIFTETEIKDVFNGSMEFVEQIGWINGNIIQAVISQGGW